MQAADHGHLDGLRDQHARPPPRPHLREASLLARLHAGQPHHRAARDHRGLPGLPHLRRRVGGGPGRADRPRPPGRPHRPRPRVHRAGGRPGQAAHADHDRARSTTGSTTSSRCALRSRPARPTARSGWTSSCASSRSPGPSPPRATRTPPSIASTASSRSTRWAATPAASAPRSPSSTPRTSSAARRSPHALSATSTHDTKRGEDVRAAHQRALGDPRRVAGRGCRPGTGSTASTTRWSTGAPVPGTNDEYLLYQTLVGAWPIDVDAPARLHAQGGARGQGPHLAGSIPTRATTRRSRGSWRRSSTPTGRRPSSRTSWCSRPASPTSAC